MIYKLSNIGIVILNYNGEKFLKKFLPDILKYSPKSKIYIIDNSGKKIANYRGIGLSEMIESINNNRFSRCNLDLSLHVLEVMEGILIAAETQKIYLTQSIYYYYLF